VTEEPRTVSGKWMILSVVGIGVGMAVAAWLYFFFQQRRPLEFWGPSAARLIARAPVVDGIWLVAPDAALSGENASEVKTLTIDGRRYRIAKKRDLSTAPGLTHLRHGMVNDRCFQWDAPAGPEKPDWRYVLHFTDGGQEATLLFAPDAKRVRLLESGGEVSIAPVSDGIRAFFEDQFPESKAATPPDSGGGQG
jgi:hypothetical protein